MRATTREALHSLAGNPLPTTAIAPGWSWQTDMEPRGTEPTLQQSKRPAWTLTPVL